MHATAKPSEGMCSRSSFRTKGSRDPYPLPPSTSMSHQFALGKPGSVTAAQLQQRQQVAITPKTQQHISTSDTPSRYSWLPNCEGSRRNVAPFNRSATRSVSCSSHWGFSDNRSGGDGGSGGGGSGGGGDSNNSSDDNSEWGGGLHQILLLLFSLTCQQALKPAWAHAGRGRNQSWDSDTVAKNLSDLAWPILCNLGFSGGVGFCAGVALKTVGKFLALMVGVVFVLTQVGAHLGYVSVNWAKMQQQVAKTFDLDRNGRLDKNDFQKCIAYVLGLLGQGIPSIVGFNMGFVLGLQV